MDKLDVRKIERRLLKSKLTKREPNKIAKLIDSSVAKKLGLK